jgi:hypothetical protein
MLASCESGASTPGKSRTMAMAIRMATAAPNRRCVNVGMHGSLAEPVTVQSSSGDFMAAFGRELGSLAPAHAKIRMGAHHGNRLQHRQPR